MVIELAYLNDDQFNRPDKYPAGTVVQVLKQSPDDLLIVRGYHIPLMEANPWTVPADAVTSFFKEIIGPDKHPLEEST